MDAIRSALKQESVLCSSASRVVVSTQTKDYPTSSWGSYVYYVSFITIICCEITIVSLSSQFFKSFLQLNWFYAVSFAATIEMLYMISSGLSSKKATITRWTLLLCSAITVTYSAYLKDNYVLSRSDLIAGQRIQIKERLETIKREVNSHIKKDELLNESHSIYNQSVRVTKGLTTIDSQYFNNQKNKSLLLAEQKDLWKSQMDLAKSQQSSGFFNDFFYLSAVTKLMIFIFLVVQFSISLYLPELIKGIKGNIK